MTGAPGEDALDGIKIPQCGRLYRPGPGGVRIISLRCISGRSRPRSYRQTWTGGTPAVARAT